MIIEDVGKVKDNVTEKLVVAKKQKNIWKLYEVFMKDKSIMNEEELKDHKGCCLVVNRNGSQRDHVGAWR